VSDRDERIEKALKVTANERVVARFTQTMTRVDVMGTEANWETEELHLRKLNSILHEIDENGFNQEYADALYQLGVINNWQRDNPELSQWEVQLVDCLLTSLQKHRPDDPQIIILQSRLDGLH
jgi:arginyl-tRNA synthetase